MKNRGNLNNLRDCVKIAFENGSERGYEFKKMRFAIILELKRLDCKSSEIKDKLLEWNKRCEKKLSLGEQKRQLLNFVDWVDKNDCRLGCNALKDFCIGEDNCSFHKNKVLFNKKTTEELPFDFNEVKGFLETRYRAEGYVMFLVVKNLRRLQLEKSTGEVILVGCRTISSMIRDHDGHMIDHMTIWRRIQDLISEGILEIVIKGKRGNFTNQANGYKFLSWKPPSIHPY